jgi:hypothetical protein
MLKQVFISVEIYGYKDVNDLQEFKSWYTSSSTYVDTYWLHDFTLDPVTFPFTKVPNSDTKLSSYLNIADYDDSGLETEKHYSSFTIYRNAIYYI